MTAPARPLPVAPWLAAYAAAAAVLVLSGLHDLQTSDSLIFSLLSLYHPAAYFWEQDRVGMLVPLATAWVRHPFANLLVQTGTTTFFGLAVPFLLVRLLAPSPGNAFAAAAATAWYLAAAPDVLHENQFIVCCYPTALFLGCCGLLVLERDVRGRLPAWRVALAAVFMALAHWVYVAAVILLLPLAFARAWAGPPAGGWLLRPLRDRIAWAGAAVTLAGFAVGYVMMTTCHDLPPGHEPTPSALLESHRWVAAWLAFLTKLAARPGAADWLTGLGAAAAAGLVVAAVRRRRDDFAFLPAAVTLLAVGGAELAVMGVHEWTSDNDHHPRYILGLLDAAAAAAALAAVAPVRRRLDRLGPRVLVPAAIAMLLAAAVGRYGWPSVGRVRAIIDEKFGHYTEDVIESGCPAVGGQYWVMWPTIYHVNLVRYERGLPGVVFPVGWRTHAWRGHWQEAARGGPFRVAVPKGEFGETNREAVWRGLEPLAHVGEYKSLDIYTTRPRPPADP